MACSLKAKLSFRHACLCHRRRRRRRGEPLSVDDSVPTRGSVTGSNPSYTQAILVPDTGSGRTARPRTAFWIGGKSRYTHSTPSDGWACCACSKREPSSFVSTIITNGLLVSRIACLPRRHRRILSESRRNTTLIQPSQFGTPTAGRFVLPSYTPQQSLDIRCLAAFA